MVRPVKAVLTALRLEAALPAGDFGPEESWALARLAANWASEVGCGVGAGDRLDGGLGGGGGLLQWLLFFG